MVGVLHHDQQLSDDLILPNLEKGVDFFYDPASRQLRESYRWYQKWFKIGLDGYADLQPQVDTVLEHLHAEQARNR